MVCYGDFMLYKILENDSSKLELQKEKYTGTDNEKILENLLADNMEMLFTDNGLVTICQEHPFQAIQDITAIDENGTLYIFELKKDVVNDDAINQILRYTNNYIGKGYDFLNYKYKQYTKLEQDLKDKLKEVYELSETIPEDKYNSSMKLILIGQDADPNVIKKISYWRKRGVDIVFLPYRVFNIGGSCYFEISSLPFDNQFFLSKKGILFDTNKTYESYVLPDDKSSTDYMIENNRVSAWGDANRFVYSFNKNDIAFLYESGRGIVAYGVVCSDTLDDSNNEKYRKLKNFKDIRNKPISAYELKSIVKHNFYFANTTKRPYLSEDECKLIIEEINKR